MLVSDLLTEALQDLGVIQAGETPTDADMQLAYNRFNRFLDRCATERLTIPFLTRTTWALTSTAPNTYTVGTGGTVNIVRPTIIDHINYVDTNQTPNLELPLTPLTPDAYAAIPLKDLTSPLPGAWYWQPTYAGGLGTLTLFPAPSRTGLLGAIYVPTAVPQFTSTSNTFVLPPGYREFLATNLAVFLAPAFEKNQVNPALIKAADESRRSIKRLNNPLSDLAVDAAALGATRLGWYNVFSG